VFIRRCQAEGFRDWSTAQVVETVRHLALAIDAAEIAPGDRVAIMSESRPEWVFCDLAILLAGGITVPIYPTLSAAQARYILQDCGARVLIVSDAAQAAKAQEVRHLLPALELVVVIDPHGAAGSAPLGASVTTLAELEARGRELASRSPDALGRVQARAAAVKPGDLATIIYTSGTTGEPKGVMLSHDNIVSNLIAIEPILDKGPDDVALSFLPLSHSFERTVVYSYLADGVTVVFAEHIDSLARDLPKTAPTIMTAVPRVFEKLHARIREAVQQSPAPRRWLFGWALGAALDRVRRAQLGKASYTPSGWREVLADRLVFAKVRARVGGRLRVLISGSAPLPREIGEFFAAAGLPVLEGYGLTETSPVVSGNRPGQFRFGTVGPPIDGVEIRIAEDGEILVRGRNVMLGYWNRPDATAEAIVNGWFHTGDIGEVTADGYLRITDRKKDLLVTSGGKKVAPQPIEARLKQNPLVAEAILVGDRRRFPAALIAPNFAALEHRLRALNREIGPREQLVERPDVVGLYQEVVDGLNRDLAQYEQVKRIALIPAEFSIATGELTPKLSVRRRVVEERWQALIERIYA
jgi:long-chain acyl-CoA synthetase